MSATVTRILALPNVLSASGMEFDGNLFYVMGDDSPYLYVLSKTFKKVAQIELFKAKTKKTGRIRKKNKPDYEAMTFINWNGQHRLLMFGSGSKITREKLLVINLPKKTVRTFKLHNFYRLLKRKAAIKTGHFNLEATAVCNGLLYLFDRGTNTVFYLTEEDFYDFITGKRGTLPTLQLKKVQLPVYRGVQAGFSGANVFDGHIYFSASLERTSNWIDDGEVLGSYIGVFPAGKINKQPVCTLIRHNKKNVKAKVESLVVTGRTKTAIHMVVVTDEDDGNSTLVQLKVSF